MNRTLTRANYFDAASRSFPAAMEAFNAWIDKYKEKNNWNKLFNSDSNWQDFKGKNAPSPKYHDLPAEMQMGIFVGFVRDRGGCQWDVEDMLEFDLAVEITGFLSMLQFEYEIENGHDTHIMLTTDLEMMAGMMDECLDNDPDDGMIRRFVDGSGVKNRLTQGALNFVGLKADPPTEIVRFNMQSDSLKLTGDPHFSPEMRAREQLEAAIGFHPAETDSVTSFVAALEDWNKKVHDFRKSHSGRDGERTLTPMVDKALETLKTGLGAYPGSGTINEQMELIVLGSMAHIVDPQRYPVRDGVDELGDKLRVGARVISEGNTTVGQALTVWNQRIRDFMVGQRQTVSSASSLYLGAQPTLTRNSEADNVDGLTYRNTVDSGGNPGYYNADGELVISPVSKSLREGGVDGGGDIQL